MIGMITSSQMVLSVLNLKKKDLRLSGSDAGLLPATWIVLWGEGAAFTEAMFIIPAKLGRGSVVGDFPPPCSYSAWHFLWRTSPLCLPPFFSYLLPMKNTIYFEFFCSRWFSAHLKTIWE